MNIIMKSILITIFVFALSVQMSYSQWVIDSNGIGNRTVTSLAYSGNNIYAGTHLAWGVYLSTNGGASWTQTTLNDQDIPSLAISGNKIFAGTVFNGIYLSTNNGTTWTQTSLNNQHVHSIVVSGDTVFAGTFNGVFYSSNSGSNWAQTSLNNKRAWVLAKSGNTIFAGTEGGGLMVSTNHGTTWAQTSLATPDIRSLAINGNYIYAGTSGFGVFASSDFGTTWTQTSLNNLVVWAIAAEGSNVFAGILTGPFFYVSNDNGATWTVRNEGLSNIAFIYSLLIINDNIFAGTLVSVYERPLSEIVGIRLISNEIPDQFSLSQNYPNPFNPVTKINYSLPSTKFTILRVYHILGNEITTLVNEKQNAGSYEVEFDGSSLSSGIYFYKFNAEGFQDTKRMTLIK